jgi:AcrR family transcriptional regulator
MARPSSFDRDTALACALEAFWQHGYDQTSISDLTEAMGINPPSLYAAFGDKQTLFDEVVERYQSDPTNFIAAALAEPTAPAAAARLLHDAADQYTRGDRPHGCMVLSEPKLAEHRATSLQAVVDRLRRGVHDGDLPRGTDVDALGRFLQSVLAGMSAAARDGATAAELHTTADLALRALALPSPEPAPPPGPSRRRSRPAR